MPEVGISEPQYVGKVAGGNGSEHYKLEVDKVRLDKKEDYIGHGHECVATVRNGEPNKVEAFNYKGMTPERAKEVFYTHRIFSTLFPHNFPHFYAAFGSEKSDHPVGTIRQRVRPMELSALANPMEETELKDETDDVKYSLDVVRDITKKLRLNYSLDDASSNIMVGSDGGEYYLDTITYRPSRFDKEGVLKYMKDNGYSEADLQTIITSYDRLSALREAQATKAAEELKNLEIERTREQLKAA